MIDYKSKAVEQGIEIERDEHTYHDDGRRIVLGKMPRQWQEWATWCVYPESGMSNGHYFTNHDDALADMTARVTRGY